MTNEELQRLHRTLADSGKLIEAGWISLRLADIPRNAPSVQIEEMRNAFMAGAQHLFASIMQSLDPENEPTEADMRRMGLIEAELALFSKELQGQLRKPGHA